MTIFFADANALSPLEQALGWRPTTDFRAMDRARRREGVGNGIVTNAGSISVKRDLRWILCACQEILAIVGRREAARLPPVGLAAPVIEVLLDGLVVWDQPIPRPGKDAVKTVAAMVRGLGIRLPGPLSAALVEELLLEGDP